MKRQGENLSRLNAYIDGELTAEEAAIVARSIARDPGAAAAASSLSSLKAALQEQAATPDDFELLPPEANDGKRGLWQAGNLVAAAAVLVVCIAVAALYQWHGNAQQETAWHSLAAEIHQDWASTTADERPPSLTIPASGRLSASEVRLPDLSDTGLTPILLAPVENLDGLTGYRVGYGGSRGCRLSLFVLQGKGSLPPELAALRRGGPQVLGWQQENATYLLMARGMAEARFGLIAETLQRLTADWQPLAPETRTALQVNRQESAPCLA